MLVSARSWVIRIQEGTGVGNHGIGSGRHMEKNNAQTANINTQTRRHPHRCCSDGKRSERVHRHLRLRRSGLASKLVGLGRWAPPPAEPRADQPRTQLVWRQGVQGGRQQRERSSRFVGSWFVRLAIVGALGSTLTLSGCSTHQGEGYYREADGRGGVRSVWVDGEHITHDDDDETFSDSVVNSVLEAIFEGIWESFD